MYYYSTNEQKRKWIGGAAAVIYLALWGVLCFVVSFTFPEPADTGEGILINFGNVELAGGEEDTALAEDIGQAQQPASAPSEPQEFVTQDFADAPAVAANPQKPAQKPAEKTEEEEKPRVVNPLALFPGRTAGSTSPSEGTATGAGNQGNLAGDPTGSHDVTGTGTSGISFELPSGRKPVGEVRPNYSGNERGRFIVKVRVTVNFEGTVVSAEYQSQGSTTNSRSFVDEALKAARRQKFSPSTEENLQTGVITYIFNVQ